jgi:hypothetical protein
MIRLRLIAARTVERVPTDTRIATARVAGAASITDSLCQTARGQASALREMLGTRPPSVLSAPKAIEEDEAPQDAGAEAAAPGGHLAVRPVPSTEGTAGP